METILVIKGKAKEIWPILKQMAEDEQREQRQESQHRCVRCDNPGATYRSYRGLTSGPFCDSCYEDWKVDRGSVKEAQTDGNKEG